MTAYRFCLYAVANFYKLFTMKKHFITGLLATFAIAASAQSFTEWQNPEVNAVNRAPMHPTILPMSRQMLRLVEQKNILPIT